MGCAFTGLADDLNALEWNPAGLAGLRAAEISALHTQYLVDTTYEMLGYAQPFGALGTLAIGAATLDYGELPRFPERSDSLPGAPSGSTTARDLYLTAGWGTSLRPALGLRQVMVGGSLTFVNQQLSRGSLAGIGTSLGALADLPVEGLRVGLALDNAGVAAGAGSGRPLPVRWVLGTSLRQHLGSELAGIAAADMGLGRDAPFGTEAGLELTAFDLVSLRGGWRTGKTAGPTFGVGLRTPASIAPGVVFRVDYASVSSGDMGSSQRFELSARFVSRHVPLIRNLEVAQEHGIPVLRWTGRAAAYLVYRKPAAASRWSTVTERPAMEPSIALTGIPGRYVYKVVPVDPATGQSFETEAIEIEVTLSGGESPAGP
jgi:hypothetical protein